MSRPSDHFDSPAPAPRSEINQPKLGIVGYLRFFWRQLTSMRVALLLLLLLAIAAVPGSLFPQRAADPNGVVQYFSANPTSAPILDKFQLFDVYTSIWFSAIYLLLFISLIGCVVPRATHHYKALRSRPPRTPVHLERLASFAAYDLPAGETDAAGNPFTPASVVEAARAVLRKSRYRVQLFDGRELSVSAERGYARETGNLVFHIAMIGILIAVGVGGSIGYTGQKVVVVGQAFVNVRSAFDSFNPGRLFTDDFLQPYRLVLNSFSATYEEKNLNAIGEATDYTADMTSYGPDGKGVKQVLKVNYPLEIGGNQIYLLGNGYAPKVTVKDSAGKVVFTDSVPCLPQDANLTSVCIIKVPDAVKQLGMVGFFYPTASNLSTGALASVHPALGNPTLTLRVYQGDLGINKGVPKSVYALNTDGMKEIVGPDVSTHSIDLTPGKTATLPGGNGTITFDNVSPPSTKANDLTKSVPRYVSLDIHSDPTQGWVLFFAICVVAGLLTSLFIPRRRVWVKVIERADGGLRLEYAGLARGEDPGLEAAVADLARRHSRQLGLKLSS
ncbi:MAG: cytochrome c biosis protein [Microbacteriaceae bacterium]|jgi:cytochrome c biogenesis protein|nr:cytochrome biosis protein [Microbacteriaceae bacterium]MCU1582875.1 cytochrome biosis protein [Microbacteriaceae bacterium]MDQ1548644.1 cytochrome c biosis protein [Microbacteriaceae bacterium]MDQ1553969.1 cytochrome c biosis protein [Microbacteriaceae bacterium]MDQ1607250.1 cytochrome c biosis protein [Microbacteriaceae bacterium]